MTNSSAMLSTVFRLLISGFLAVAWLIASSDARTSGSVAGAANSVHAPPAISGGSSTLQGATAETPVSTLLDVRAKAIRAHIDGLVAAAPGLLADMERGGSALLGELAAFGVAKALLIVAVAGACGIGLEGGLRRAIAGNWRWPKHYRPATVNERLRVVGTRLLVAMAGLAVFSLGTVGVFLIVDWPPLLEAVALLYLLAYCGFRAAHMSSRLILALDISGPVAAELRGLPVGDAAARQWHGYVSLLAGWFAFGWATVRSIDALGVTPAGRQIVAYAAGLGLLAIALMVVWRPGPHANEATAVQKVAHRADRWLLSGYYTLLWGLWVVSAMPAFWLCAVSGAVIASLDVLRRAVSHLTRPIGEPSQGAEIPSLGVVCTERVLRAGLIIGAAAFVVRVWDVNLTDVMAGTTLFSRVTHAALNILVIGLAADLGWQIVRVLIERRLGSLGTAQDQVLDDAHRSARLRTLLPIVRKFAAVLIFTMAALMMLSEAGIQIGPLIAGAGVVGLAVGFGAQTLVRDIFSGFFYLLDDAFRVGEYIQSGNYKGTVESFSIRSVRLRHHRGPLYTIPFGVLGAVQNMSRDWVIDILTVGVTYDTDLDIVKRIIKDIGAQLSRDAELGPLILSPLKMQGVQQFGDFAIQIRMKMMTRPGEQFAVRRKAYAMIKKAFDASGIKFAFPTVQVAGGEAPVAAAAAQALQKASPVAS